MSKAMVVLAFALVACLLFSTPVVARGGGGEDYDSEDGGSGANGFFWQGKPWSPCRSFTTGPVCGWGFRFRSLECTNGYITSSVACYFSPPLSRVETCLINNVPCAGERSAAPLVKDPNFDIVWTVPPTMPVAPTAADKIRVLFVTQRKGWAGFGLSSTDLETGHKKMESWRVSCSPCKLENGFSDKEEDPPEDKGDVAVLTGGMLVDNCMVAEIEIPLLRSGSENIVIDDKELGLFWAYHYDNKDLKKKHTKWGKGKQKFLLPPGSPTPVPTPIPTPVPTPVPVPIAPPTPVVEVGQPTAPEPPPSDVFQPNADPYAFWVVRPRPDIYLGDTIEGTWRINGKADVTHTNLHACLRTSMNDAIAVHCECTTDICVPSYTASERWENVTGNAQFIGHLMLDKPGIWIVEAHLDVSYMAIPVNETVPVHKEDVFWMSSVVEVLPSSYAAPATDAVNAFWVKAPPPSVFSGEMISVIWQHSTNTGSIVTHAVACLLASVVGTNCPETDPSFTRSERWDSNKSKGSYTGHLVFPVAGVYQVNIMTSINGASSVQSYPLRVTVSDGNADVYKNVVTSFRHLPLLPSEQAVIVPTTSTGIATITYLYPFPSRFPLGQIVTAVWKATGLAGKYLIHSNIHACPEADMKALHCELYSDAAKTILVPGYNPSENWISTLKMEEAQVMSGHLALYSAGKYIIDLHLQYADDAQGTNMVTQWVQSSVLVADFRKFTPGRESINTRTITLTATGILSLAVAAKKVAQFSTIMGFDPKRIVIISTLPQPGSGTTMVKIAVLPPYLSGTGAEIELTAEQMAIKIRAELLPGGKLYNVFALDTNAAISEIVSEEILLNTCADGSFGAVCNPEAFGLASSQENTTEESNGSTVIIVVIVVVLVVLVLVAVGVRRLNASKSSQDASAGTLLRKTDSSNPPNDEVTRVSDSHNPPLSMSKQESNTMMQSARAPTTHKQLAPPPKSMSKKQLQTVEV